MKVRPLLLAAALGLSACAPNYIDLGYDYLPIATGGSVCASGETRECYSGPDGTKGKGICRAGQETCNSDGSAFGPCVGEVTPKPAEDCATPEDDDCNGTAPTCDGLVAWAKRFGNSSVQRAEAVAADSDGNVFATGLFHGTIDFGNGPLVATSGGIMEGSDVFVAKFDPTGTPLFSERFGDGYSQAGRALTVDMLGDIAFAGSFGGEIDFGGGPLGPADEEADIFVAKLRGVDGTHLWSKTLGGDPGVLPGYAIAFDPAGDVVVAGSFAKSIDLGAGQVTAAGSTDIFVAKLDGETGAHVWSRTFGGGGVQLARGVTVGDDGDVILTGGFEQEIDLGGGALTSAGAHDVFVAKLDGATGAHLWSTSFGDKGDDLGNAVATIPGGNIAACGQEGAADADLFVAQLDSNGILQWTKTPATAGVQQGTSIAVDSASNIVAVGSFEGSIDLGSGAKISSAGGLDMFVIKLDGTGAPLWSRRYGDSSEQDATGVTVDGANNVLLSGALWGSMDVGSETLISDGTFDAVVMKLAP